DRDLLPGSPAWAPGAATATAGALAALGRFLGSTVAWTLYIDGAYLLPIFFVLANRWGGAAWRDAGVEPPPRALRTLTYLAGVLLLGLGGAALCALGVRGVAYL